MFGTDTHSHDDLPEDFLDVLPEDMDQALLNDWITESREFLDEAETALLLLESDHSNMDALNSVFRAFHTMKGTAGFIGLTGVASFAHHAESLLSSMRDGNIRCSGEYADLALKSIDALKDVLRCAEEGSQGHPILKPFGYEDLILKLENPTEAGLSDEGHAESPDTIVNTQREARSSGKTVKVRTDRLDRLIDMVGELVVAEGIVAQDPIISSGENPDLSRKINQAEKIVRELQTLSLAMRMVPLNSTIQKITRLVRDLSHDNDKLIEVISDAEDTEVDRNMLENLTDALMHMARNAVDHGIETPDERADIGKPEVGTILLRAYHSGTNVVVELMDDGRGLNRDKIVETAISRGLIEEDDDLSEREVFNLIFAPGFSTASSITSVSGRGVGMDVVQSIIEEVQGKIDISSEEGFGSKFTISLPLTLSVTDGMLVLVGNERYVIPAASIHLCFRPDKEMLSTDPAQGDMVTLRGEMLPLFRLYRLFAIDHAIDDPTDGLVVILDDEERRCALLVDELLGQHHVMSKSLGQAMGKKQGISGGAVLGDGRVGLILDTAELISMARTMRDSGGSPGIPAAS